MRKGIVVGGFTAFFVFSVLGSSSIDPALLFGCLRSVRFGGN
jgi:hypothetical protein